jgi:hypothetical protein
LCAIGIDGMSAPTETSAPLTGLPDFASLSAIRQS